MNQEILDYIKSQNVGVLAVEMLDGSPHAATLHFASTDEPLVFYFKTHQDYRKSEALLSKDITRASFVIGATESEMKTLQLDGEARLVTDAEKSMFDEAYYGKFPNKKKAGDPDPKAVYFMFTPKWWRYTDWTKPEGKKIVTSE